MPTDHSDDRPAAPTPRARTVAGRLDEVREHMRHHINALGGAEQRVPVDIALAGVEALCDLLLPLAATVERLEAAEQAKAGRGEKGNQQPIACGLEDSAEAHVVAAPSAPVPPSPPAAGESEKQQMWRVLAEFDWLHARDSGSAALQTECVVSMAYELASLRSDLAEARGRLDAAEKHNEILSIARSADSQELARLRARLAGEVSSADVWDGLTTVHRDALVAWLRGGGVDMRRLDAALIALRTAILLPDEPEGLTTDSTNPEPGRGTK